MANVARIEKYRAKDTIETLRALLANAERGHLTGLVVAWRCKTGNCGTVTTGDYAKDHMAALGATSKLFFKINESAAECDLPD